MEISYLTIRTSGGYLYGGDQKLFGRKASRSGCGMIAACDYILYSSGKRDISFNEYSAFVNKFRDEEAYRRSSNPFGIYPRKLIRLINAHVPGKETKFISRLRLNEKMLTDHIRSSIRADIPIIVRIGLNGKKFPYEINYPYRGGRVCRGAVGWHYITVTGISDDGKITFSSWGGKGTSDCGELFRHFGITGGIIADKRIFDKIRK